MIVQNPSIQKYLSGEQNWLLFAFKGEVPTEMPYDTLEEMVENCEFANYVKRRSIDTEVTSFDFADLFLRAKKEAVDPTTGRNIISPRFVVQNENFVSRAYSHLTKFTENFGSNWQNAPAECDLGEPLQVTGIRVHQGSQYHTDWRLEYWDGDQWVEALRQTEYAKLFDKNISVPVTAQRWRIRVQGSSSAFNGMHVEFFIDSASTIADPVEATWFCLVRQNVHHDAAIFGTAGLPNANAEATFSEAPAANKAPFVMHLKVK